MSVTVWIDVFIGLEIAARIEDNESILVTTPGVIYLTNQRSAWIGFGLCIVLLAVGKSPMRRAARLVVALSLLGFLFGVATHFSLWEGGTLFSKRQATVDYRVANNVTTWAMGIANPIFGVGFGNFWTAWPKYFQPVPGVPDLKDGNHNTFLGLFSEVGLVGLLPFLMICYQMLRVAFRVYSRTEGFEREFCRISLLVMLSYLFGANFSDYRSGPFHNTALYILFGAVAAMAVPKVRQNALSPAPPSMLGRMTSDLALR